MAKWFVALVLLCGAMSGCADDARPLYDLEPAPEPAVAAGDRFDPTRCGTVRGRVSWSGELPSAKLLKTDASAKTPGMPSFVPNPNLPRIDPVGRGVAGAFVWLKGVDARRARSWDHPPVRIRGELDRIAVAQGDRTGSVGIVRVGDSIEVESAAPTPQALRARGSEFFTLALPDPGKVRTRTILRSGVSELTCAANGYWKRGYLLASDHPYCAPTDAEGRFSLELVPDGEYDAVCWLPNWKEAGNERDPESCQVARMFFHAPLQLSARIAVVAGTTTQRDWALERTQFPGP